MANFYAFQQDDPAFATGVDMRELPYPNLSATATNATHYSLKIVGGDRSVDFFGTANDWFEYAGFSLWPVAGSAGSAIFYYKDKFSFSILEAEHRWGSNAFDGYVYEGRTLAGFDGLIAAFLSGNDSIKGSLEDDYLIGYEGNDVIEYLAGHDTLDGGPGTDTVKFLWPQDWYSITKTGNTFDVVMTYGGAAPEAPENTAHLISIERLVFGDEGVAYDLDGAAGDAARLIGLVTGKDMLQDKGLVGEVLQAVDELSLTGVSKLLVDSGIISDFAGGSDSSNLLGLLFQNVYGKAATAAELRTLVRETVGISQAQIIEIVASSDVVADLVGLPALANVGLAYDSWL